MGNTANGMTIIENLTLASGETATWTHNVGKKAIRVDQLHGGANQNFLTITNNDNEMIIENQAPAIGVGVTRTATLWVYFDVISIQRSSTLPGTTLPIS